MIDTFFILFKRSHLMKNSLVAQKYFPNQLHGYLKYVTALSLLSSCSIAIAQEDTETASDKETTQLETINVSGKRENSLDLNASNTTGSKLNLTVRETPASIEIIDQETLERRGARTFEEALRGATGVTSTNNPYSPGIAATRGFAAGAMSYLYDGVRISVPTMSSRPQDTFNYERIEVLKGPSSVLYGEGAVGGAVNFVTKRPDRTHTESEAVLSYGSFDTTRLGIGTGGKLGESGAFRFDYSHNQTHGYIDRTRLKMDNLTTAATFDLTSTLKLDLSLNYLKDKGQVAFGTFLIPANLASEPTHVVSDATGRVVDKQFAFKNFNLTDSYSDASSVWGKGAVSWKFADGWTLRNELSLYKADRRWLDAESLTFQAPSTLIFDQVGVVHDHTVMSHRLDVSYDGVWASRRNRFTAGVEYSKTDFESERRFSNGSASTNATLQQSIFNPGAVRFIDNAALYAGAGNQTNFTTDITTTAFFIEDALSLSKRWTVVGGLRTEGINLHRTVDDLNTGSFDAFSKHYRANSYRVGAVYNFSDNTTFYSQYTNAAAPVGTSNLLLLSRANTAFPLTRGVQWEVGLKQALTPRFDWTLALYDIKQSNVLSRDPITPTLTVNNGRISSRGIELSAHWKATRQLSLGANVAALNAQFETLIEAGNVSRVGNVPPNVPERTANLWVDYKFPQLPLTSGVAFNHVGALYTNNANSVKINGYTTADAYLRYTLKPGTSLALRVRNIADKYYANWTGANANNQVIMGAPRSVDLTLKLMF